MSKRVTGNRDIFVIFSSENATEGDNSEQEGEPPFTLHIGMLFTAMCRLVTCLSSFYLSDRLKECNSKFNHY